MFARLAQTLVVSSFVALALASACGGKSKPAATVPAEPAGGGAYGGDAYGGDAYGGDAYGGAVYGAAAGNGTFDCVSGVAECDQLFGKVVACAKTATKIGDAERTQIIDQMQEACSQLKQAVAQAPDQTAQIADACKQGLEQAEASAAQEMGCTW